VLIKKQYIAVAQGTAAPSYDL